MLKIVNKEQQSIVGMNGEVKDFVIINTVSF